MEEMNRSYEDTRRILSNVISLITLLQLIITMCKSRSPIFVSSVPFLSVLTHAAFAFLGKMPISNKDDKYLNNAHYNIYKQKH